MKKYGLMLTSFAALITAAAVIPSLLAPAEKASSSEETTAPAPEPESTIQMLDTSSGEVLTLSMEEYLIGAVSAEMPASFEPEALKAQTVAAHTYAVRQQNLQSKSPDPELCGADLSNDSTKYQAYFTQSQTMQFYGTGYDSAYTKISAAVKEVLPYIIVYENEPILAAFCSMSSGKTESAENVWGQAVPYLTVADSSADKNAPNYSQCTYFSAADLRTKLMEAFPECNLDVSTNQWLIVESTSESGTVLTANVGGTAATGQEIRTALGLRSAAFEVEWKEGSCAITTKGYGHGVGMSQYGANAMAKAGADWREILLYYYKGAEIEEE